MTTNHIPRPGRGQLNLNTLLLAADLAPSGTLTLGQATQLAQYFYSQGQPAAATIVPVAPVSPAPSTPAAS